MQELEDSRDLLRTVAMEQQTIPLEKLGIPPELSRYVDTSAPKEVRLLAARGLIPAPPKVLISIQYCLVGDPETTVAAAARESLLAYPTKMVENAFDEKTHSKVLEFFAFNRTHDERLVEVLLLKRHVRSHLLVRQPHWTVP